MEFKISAWINDDLLFISKENGVWSFNTGKELIKEQFRGQTYYRYPKTDKRISVYTIRKNMESIIGVIV